ncbi:MAG: bifunctional phosphoribosylaminoimidazolecarboxamide formyltransferase/IMP cyclohydrolase [Planctomycetaceae bacterium]|nr:bifunctional phosphoribosylaminoimidazolecarboxamide formyltransferase/IMP cyclohydrolase [Planctomycetaceae bacterium]
MSASPPVRRALISVSDKQGLAEWVRELAAAGIEILSTGGTRAHLEAAGIPVRDVSAYTGFPEIMDGRVKTLHPKIHGGILCRHDVAEDQRVLAELGILSIELVVVNLYPFEATVAKPQVAFDEAIENIDIGGPSLVRGAAKNHAFTTIVTSPAQYAPVLEEIRQTGCTSLELRRRLAAEAYAHTAAYDAAIAGWFAKQIGTSDVLAPRITLPLVQQSELRYGENPHQRGALYKLSGEGSGTLAAGQQLHGKELSYNNWLDLDSALAIVRDLAGPAVSVIKHNNPCGAAAHAELAVATRRALDGDPLSAFGGVLGFNRPVDAASAEVLAEPNRFIEAIVAPSFEPAAIEILTTKPKWKANVRLVAVGVPPAAAAGSWDFRRISGGMLVQDRDNQLDPEAEWKVVTTRTPSASELRDLKFAWALVRHVKSNAITVASDATLRGAGAGQMSRVDSVEIALKKAGAHARGAALGSDAFFPFADSIPLAAQAGITCCIQPGGSRNDSEVIAACDEHGLAMIFTGRRHFKH